MAKILINNGIIVNEGIKFKGYLVIEGERIAKVEKGTFTGPLEGFDKVVDAVGSIVMPGVIDDHVHFRDFGMAYKADFRSESRAAVAGGVTSYMEMPNSSPPTTSIAALEEKFTHAAGVSAANYSFYFGATEENIPVLASLDVKRVCGVKLFMGSSTGNLLIDNATLQERVFRDSPVLVAIHSEKESIIKENARLFREEYGDRMTAAMHPQIRNTEACYVSTAEAVEMAEKFGTQLHVLHLTTAQELSLFGKGPLEKKKITCEVTPHHLWFSDEDYAMKGNMIKWNPAIKSAEDRQALREGLVAGLIDVVGTDHAPHTLEEKMRPYTEAPSGGPSIEHSLAAMMQMADSMGSPFTPETVIKKMCHAPAVLYKIKERGFLREGYFADIAIVKMGDAWTVERERLWTKCGWSPFEEYTFRNRVTHTFVNGSAAYENGVMNDAIRGRELVFER